VVVYIFSYIERCFMKRFLVVFLMVAAASGAFAAGYNFSQFQAGFSDFATSVAAGLPLNASTGLNWSDAYIGQLLDAPPHFGVGVTVGATLVPSSALGKVTSALGVSLPSNLSYLASLGVPIPAYTIEGRIGGFVLPFDIGLKFGYLSPSMTSNLNLGFTVNYLLAGADIRFALLKGDVVLPSISVGLGYSYMQGGFSIPHVLGTNVAMGSFTYNGTPYNLNMSDPTLDFNWSSNVIDLKVQISKSLLLFTPYAGVAASYAFSSAGGGASSTIQNGSTPLSSADISNINAYFASQGQSITLANQNFVVSSGANGFAFRAFGGFSFNIFILRLDIGAMYDLLGGNWGGALNTRIQL
jgi:hypothetical protein